jgi:hypothetical protein
MVRGILEWIILTIFLFALTFPVPCGRTASARIFPPEPRHCGSATLRCTGWKQRHRSSGLALGLQSSRHPINSGEDDLLIASTIVMKAVVVTINRLVWRKLYVLAEIRYKLEY